MTVEQELALNDCREALLKIALGAIATVAVTIFLVFEIEGSRSLAIAVGGVAVLQLQMLGAVSTMIQMHTIIHH